MFQIRWLVAVLLLLVFFFEFLDFGHWVLEFEYWNLTTGIWYLIFG